MQRRKERGNDGREVNQKNRGRAPDEITRGRGELPEEEIPEGNNANEPVRDSKDDRRERRRDRHE